MYIPNEYTINRSVDYNYWLKRLGIQFNDPTNQNSIKVPKVDKSVKNITQNYPTVDYNKWFGLKQQ